MKTAQLVKFGFGIVVIAIVGVLGIAVLSLPTEAAGLSAAVDAKLSQAGANNPVTAVLLNFRGYDTLLEIVVLLLAVLGAQALTATGVVDKSQAVVAQDKPVLTGLIRIVAPVMILVAGYLLWVGGHAPGGAFQAGAVLASLGVLLQLGGIDWAKDLSERSERLLVVAGLVVFLAIGAGTMSNERHFLGFAPTAAKSLILVIEAAATLSIAAILLALFCGGTLRRNYQPLESNKKSSK